MSAVIQQVLELSADAHIARRLTVKGSPAFHRLTGVITAYGKALELLVGLWGCPQCESSRTNEVYLELFSLLELYAPTWYKEEHHNRAAAALGLSSE